MKKIFTSLMLSAFLGLSAIAQNEQFDLNFIIKAKDKIASYALNDKYVFYKQINNDTIFVLDIKSKKIIKKEKINGGVSRATNGKLFLTIDSYSFDCYNISNINSWIKQSVTGLGRGFFTNATLDTNYIGWCEHWNSSIKIFNLGQFPIVQKCALATDGNVQGGSSVGANIFLATNAYSQCIKIDLSNCTKTNFGGKSSPSLFLANDYIVYDEHFNSPSRFTIYNQSGTMTGTLNKPVEDSWLNIAFDNYCIIYYGDKTGRLYDLNSGTFNFVKNIYTGTNRGFFVNKEYLVSNLNDSLLFYNRIKPINQCTETIYDTVKVFVYDTIKLTVTDTLKINMNHTGTNPITYKNSIKIYPNPTNDKITIDFGTNYNSLNGYKIKILNSISQTVYEANIIKQTSSIDLNNWTGKGIYYVQLIDGNNNIIENKKIVLQ